MTIYYHVAMRGLSPQLVLEPGAFGRALLDTNQLFLREAVLEAVRVIEFPDRPSRLRCVFGLPSLSDAREFSTATDAPAGGVLYEIEVADNTPIHQGRMGWLAEAGGGDADVGRSVNAAHAYWSGMAHPTGPSELVIGGPVRVVRQLSAGRGRY